MIESKDWWQRQEVGCAQHHILENQVYRSSVINTSTHLCYQHPASKHGKSASQMELPRLGSIWMCQVSVCLILYWLPLCHMKAGSRGKGNNYPFCVISVAGRNGVTSGPEASPSHPWISAKDS